MTRSPGSSAVLAAAFVLVACGRKDGVPGAGAAASATPPPPAPPPAESAPAANAPADPTQLRAPTDACRAMSVAGEARSESGAPVNRGSPLDGREWVDVREGGQIAVQHVLTTRALEFDGPGRVRPCARGDEQVLFTTGTVKTTPGAGARPGAEVLLATPLGVVRYGDARLTLRVDSHGLELEVSAGAADLEAAGGPAEHVLAGHKTKRKSAHVDVQALVDGCGKAAEQSEAKARAVLAPPPSAAPLGERAAEHVRARQAARAVCARALAGLGTLPTGPERAALEHAVSRAEMAWRGVPSRLEPPGKVESR